MVSSSYQYVQHVPTGVVYGCVSADVAFSASSVLMAVIYTQPLFMSL